MGIFALQSESKSFNSPVLGAELKMDMASFPSGTGVEWPVGGISLVPIPSSDYKKKIRDFMGMNLSYVRTNVFPWSSQTQGSELKTRFTKDSMDNIQL